MSYPFSKNKKEIKELFGKNIKEVNIVKVIVPPNTWIQAEKGGEFWTYIIKGEELPKGMKRVKEVSN